MRCLIAGLIGGVVGAVIWGAITHFTGYELGWVAWGIGALVGAVMYKAAGTDRRSVRRGVMAALIALVSIAAGKYIVVYAAVRAEVAAARAQAITDTEMEVLVADRLVEEAEEAGTTLA